jgi:hypothetical protein
MRHEAAAPDVYAGEFTIAKQSIDRVSGNSVQSFSGFGGGIQCAIFHGTLMRLSLWSALSNSPSE